MSVDELRDNNEDKLNSEQRVIDAETPTSSNVESNIVFLVFFLLKLGGMLLLFLCVKYIFALLLGSRVAFYTDSYWIFVCLGLIPACIAKYKGHNFWAWWFLGSYCPIISIFMAIELDSIDD